MEPERCEMCERAAVVPGWNMQVPLCAHHKARTCACGAYVVPDGAAEYRADGCEAGDVHAVTVCRISVGVEPGAGPWVETKSHGEPHPHGGPECPECGR